MQDFEAEQVWEYETRDGEESSRLYIVKVEPWGNGEKIFHIYVDGLKIKNPMLAGGVQTVLPHAPVSSETLMLSVTRLQEEAVVPLPDIDEGYACWKEEFDAGNAGAFTIPVSRIVTLIESVVARRDSPKEGIQ